jgi:hypothetical protein
MATIGSGTVVPVVVSGSATTAMGSPNGVYSYKGICSSNDHCTNGTIYYQRGTDSWYIWYDASDWGGWLITSSLGSWPYGWVGGAGSTPPLYSGWSLAGSGTGTPTTSAGSLSSLVVDGSGDMTSGGNLNLTGTGNSYILGNVGIGTSGPVSTLSVKGTTGVNPFFVASSTGAGLMVIQQNGNVGIGTTNPANFKLQVAGNVGPDANNSYDLGSASNDWRCVYMGNATLGTCSSDIRLKNNIQELDFTQQIGNAEVDALTQVAGLHLHSFSYNSDPTNNIYHGLIAQEVEQLSPELVTTGTNGYEAVNYGDVEWLTVQAVQQLNLNVASIAGDSAALASSTPASQKFVAEFFQNLFSKIGSWLADATNGLTDVFANAFHAKNEICVDNQCLNADDVRNLLALVASSTPNSTSARTGSNTATSALGSSLSLIVQGNNPATISVGDVYNDLGAIISSASPTADLNLGIFASVDGGATTTPAEIAIDTRAAGTHVITYSVTDMAGVTASAMRTVIVAPIIGSQNLATTTTDVASSTVAISASGDSTNGNIGTGTLGTGTTTPVQ